MVMRKTEYIDDPYFVAKAKLSGADIKGDEVVVNRKPKRNNKGGPLDNCYTPSHAVLPLLPFISRPSVIWESAPGENFMVDAFVNQGYAVAFRSDYDFFDWEPDFPYTVQVTNPPYSLKYKWLKRSYELGKPFALLLPVESIGASSGNRLIAEYGAQIILMTQRVNFYMPNKGYEGSAQFPVLWWTWKLNLPKDIMVWDSKNEVFL